MPQLPLAIWFFLAGTVLLLLGLCVVTAYAVLRASARRRVSQWPIGWLLGLVAAAVLPWLVVWLAPIKLVINAHSVAALVGWLLLGLLAFVVLVLLPLAALLCAVVWGIAHGRRGPPASPAT